MALDNVVNINGVTFGFNEVRITMGGRELRGVTAISYEIKQDAEHIQGTGQNPFGVGIGPKTYEASITLLADEVRLIMDAAYALYQNGDLTSIPAVWDINVFFKDHKRLDKVLGIRFKNNAVGMKAGDKSFEHQLDLLPTNGIVFNAP